MVDGSKKHEIKLLWPYINTNLLLLNFVIYLVSNVYQMIKESTLRCLLFLAMTH